MKKLKKKEIILKILICGSNREFTYAYCILNRSRLCERINDTRPHIYTIILFSYAANWFANIMQALGSTLAYCSKCDH